MKILFIGGMYPKEYEEYFKGNMIAGGYQPAANTFQWAVIRGFQDNECDYEVVSFPSLPCYPKGYRKSKSPVLPIYVNGQRKGYALKYNTTIIYKEYSIFHALYTLLKKWVCENYNEELAILTYSPQSSILLAIKKIKRRYPQVKFCTIIADLVDDATNPIFHLSFPKLVQAKIEQYYIHKSYTFTDKFVLLSDAMTEKIPQSINNHLVVEGISGDVDMNSICLKNATTKTLLYTGTIQRFAGIFELIEAFKITTDSNYRLEICGTGDCVDEMKQVIAGDPRINYLGLVSREKAVQLQKEATLLINPRKPSVSLTRYSFPSKTMEYLASGTPMLGYKLEGIPIEYYDYFFSPESETVESLSTAIDNALKKTNEELRMFAEKARDFIRINKSSIVQVKKIIEYINA